MLNNSNNFSLFYKLVYICIVIHEAAQLYKVSQLIKKQKFKEN